MFHLHARNEMLCCSTSQRSGEGGRKKSIFLAYIKKKENNFSNLKILPTAISIHVKKYSHIKLRSQIKILRTSSCIFVVGTPPPLYSFCLSSAVSFVSLPKLYKTHCNVTSHNISFLIPHVTEEM